MSFTIWMDFVLFLLLLFMLGYIFLFNTITIIHKVYLSFHFLMLLWPLSHFAVQTTDNPQFQLFYVTVAFAALCLIGPGWLVFSIFLAGQSYLLHARSLAIVFLPSMIAVLGVLINPFNWFVQAVEGQFVNRQYGPLFWVMVFSIGLYFIVSLYYMFRTYHSGTAPRHRMQIRTAAIGILFMVGFSVVDIMINVVFADLLPVVIGMTSAGITMSAIYFLVAIQRYKVFNIVEIAQQDVIDSMNTGVMVLDEHDIVVEVNQMLRSYIDIRIGDQLDIDKLLVPLVVPDNYKAFLTSYKGQPPERAVIEVKLGKGMHVMLYTSPILDSHMTMIGRILTFQDITELRRLVEDSKRQNEVLQERNRALIMMQDELFRANQKLEQMAITDSLTGCYNRRYLMQLLEHEVMINVRYNIPFAIFLFDIDLFKNINDTYGHVVGDEVIRSTADAVKSALRRTDILARFGGEEFTVYLPHTNRAQAQMLAERVKVAVESNKVAVESMNQTVSITISMGVLAIEEAAPMTTEDSKAYLRHLFSQADAALYEAKDSGRNRIVNVKQA